MLINDACMAGVSSRLQGLGRPPAQQRIASESHLKIVTEGAVRGEERVRKAQGRWREGLGHLSVRLTSPRALVRVLMAHFPAQRSLRRAEGQLEHVQQNYIQWEPLGKTLRCWAGPDPLEPSSPSGG